jgi:spermidine/putrescine transport system permease protein
MAINVQSNHRPLISPVTVGQVSRPVTAKKIHWGRLGLAAHTLLGYLFLYLPIAVLVFFSFNGINSTAQWSGFSLRWYKELMQDPQIILALWNSLFVAVVSTVIATTLGTLAALAMERYEFYGKYAADTLLYLPLVIPDIAMGIMLLVFFNLTGLGFEPWRVAFFGHELAVPYAVIIGHVAFNVSFVIIVVRSRLTQMDRSLEEAANDLYANPWQVFRRVTLPLLMPGFLAGALLAFTLSMDDFVITFFTSGAGFNTLPVRVFGMVKNGVTPKVNALSSLMVSVSFLLILLSLMLRKRGNDNAKMDLNY